MTPFQPRDRVHLKGHDHTPATTGTVFAVTSLATHVMWDDSDCTTPQVPQYLEPAGEPMSTFKSIDDNGDAATIHGNDLGVLVGIMRNGTTVEALTVTKADAPAAALAILEAAGWPGDYPGGVSNQIVADLRRVVEITEQKAKEAAARSKWEAEALHLYNACRYSAGRTGRDSFGDLDEDQQRNWLGVAHQARTLHGVTS